MSQRHSISAPFLADEGRALNAGDEVLLSGTVFTARDAAHKRMADAARKGEAMPLDLRGAVIFYAGPSPARPGRPVGAIGPTTSSRMDFYTPILLERGLRGMIGKGDRSDEVVKSMILHGAVYLGATGGIAALLARTVVDSRLVAYDDLGPEAIRELHINEMPLRVLIDSRGRSIYCTGLERFQ